MTYLMRQKPDKVGTKLCKVQLLRSIDTLSRNIKNHTQGCQGSLGVQPEIPTAGEDSNDEASWKLEKSNIQDVMERATIPRGLHKFLCQIF